MTAPNPHSHRSLLYLVNFIYFFCGMTLCFEGAFNPEFMDLFQLNYQQQQYTTFAKNIPFVLAVAIGYCIPHIGYKNCLSVAMGLFSAGTLLLIPGLHTGNYTIMLAAFFIIGLGFNFELVAGNPLLSRLGSPEGSSSRLNLANALGAIAQIIAPLTLTFIIPASVVSLEDKLPYMKGLFAVIGGILFLIAILVLMASPAEGSEHIQSAPTHQPAMPVSHGIWTQPKIILGFVTIFLTLGIEAGMFGFYRNYLEDPAPFSASRISNLQGFAARLATQTSDPVSATLRECLSPNLVKNLTEYSKTGTSEPILGRHLAEEINQICSRSIFEKSRFSEADISPEIKTLFSKSHTGRGLIRLNRLIIESAYPDYITRSRLNSHESQRMFTVYFAVFALGRLVGSWAQKKIRPATTLVFSAVAAMLLLSLMIISEGAVAVLSATAIGFFISIFFPTLYALAIEGMGSRTAEASGLLTMGFLGCALIPVFQGWLADHIGLQTSYALGFGPYLCVLFYALKGYKMKGLPSTVASPSASAH